MTEQVHKVELGNMDLESEQRQKKWVAEENRVLVEVYMKLRTVRSCSSNKLIFLKSAILVDRNM